MSRPHAEIRQDQILWRRDKVLEMISNGYSAREIASTLRVGHATISRDIVILRQQAKADIRKYIDEQVPFEFQKTLAGLQGIIKSMATIIAKSTDSKEIMQASVIKMQAYNMKMELVSNANLVEDAIDLVERYRNVKALPLPNTYQNKEVRIDSNAEQPS
jgi:IS30 family transposase